jgi:hypothetical protein
MFSCSAFVSFGNFVGEADSMRARFRGSFIGEGDFEEGILVCFLSLSISWGVGLRPGSEVDICAAWSINEFWRVGASGRDGLGREGVLAEEWYR